ncbi:MAG: ORF6N domain-containing protein [Verrucomicrobia bacterium]|nr:ORF6N domain-containing protein [Verrucomicrobiota bacterium]
MKTSLAITQNIGPLIFAIRNHKVILDSDLARLYGVPTKRLNEQVKRNAERFPEEFMFQLTKKEIDAFSRSQFATLKQGKNVKYLPRVFTEHGVLMAASVLNSPQAIKMSVAIIKTFVNLRRMAFSIEELSQRIKILEKGFQNHGEQFAALFETIHQLLIPPDPSNREIGFHVIQK